MKKIYLTPSVVAEEVKVEKGFATSPEIETSDNFELMDIEDDGEAY